MYSYDPETGKRKLHVQLLLLHESDSPIPGLPHVTDWLKSELIHKDGQLVLDYLHDPTDIDVRRQLSARITARLQAQHDQVVTSRRRVAERDPESARHFYHLYWQREQLLEVMKFAGQHEALQDDYRRLKHRLDAIAKQKKALIQQDPDWFGELAMERVEPPLIAKDLLAERQALERVNGVL